MNFVFILGAGASVSAGAPTMKEFLDRADFLRRTTPDGKLSQHAFEDVFTARAQLSSVYEKAYLDLENIEALFSAVEMGLLVRKFGPRKQHEIQTLRDSLITLIVQTLELSIHFSIDQRGLLSVGEMPSFGASVAAARARAHDIALITFNYDLLLEAALERAGVPYDYWLGDNLVEFAVPLLKLHGSINWATCRECGRVRPVALREFLKGRSANERDLFVNLGSELQRYARCDCEHQMKVLPGPPLLVPPTWEKGAREKSLQTVWAAAAKELSRADHIVIVGYSLPETDSFFRYLFALGTQSPTRIQGIWVYNPDRDGTVEERLGKMIGRGVTERVQFRNKDVGTFKAALGEIQSLLDRE